MANNSTNINKTNNHLSPWNVEHKNDHDGMRMEIKVLAWDRHKNVAEFMDKMVFSIFKK
jgi:hypothetical protein